MKTKSLPVRSSRKSLDLYPSPASFPDKANEPFESRARTTHYDNDSCDVDVEIVPDTFDERDVPHKKRHCLGTSRGRSEIPNVDACIVCEVSDEYVSRCLRIDCPLSFHRECLNAEDLANPYCPYCWFKIVSVRYETVRKKATEAEKVVFKYLDKETINKDMMSVSGDENGNQEHSEDNTDILSDQEVQGEKDTCLSKEEQVEVEKDSDKSRGEKMLAMEESGNMKEGKVITDEVEASVDEERVDTENFEDANDQTKLNTGAEKRGRDSPFVSMQEHKQVQQMEKQKQRIRRRRQIVIDSEISSNESTNERNGEDVTEQITSTAQVTSQVGKMKNQQRKLNAATKTERDISFFKGDNRRRLFWTSEEEEMLKVGVKKFAAEANKNMPWRKILEMGDKVFHGTRTPADLKDKWRNMNGGRKKD